MHDPLEFILRVVKEDLLLRSVHVHLGEPICLLLHPGTPSISASVTTLARCCILWTGVADL